MRLWIFALGVPVLVFEVLGYNFFFFDYPQGLFRVVERRNVDLLALALEAGFLVFPKNWVPHLKVLYCWVKKIITIGSWAGLAAGVRARRGVEAGANAACHFGGPRSLS